MLSIKSFGLRVAATAITLLLVLPALAQDTVMFNYQGRVKVQGHSYNGPGQFKFAILSPDQKSTLWSNDSTSVHGSEPTTAISLEVEDGIFNVLMGKNDVMDIINSTVFQNKSPLKLRTWFNDGMHGFQALKPDHNLINVNLITSETGSKDFIVYVNGSSGDDSNSGLKPSEAKKSIQAAVDIVPPRVTANVTIEIAAGTYFEHVQLYGISCKPGKTLKIIGDKNWDPSKSGSPNVIISGSDNAATCTRRTLEAVQCNGLELEGLSLRYSSWCGINFENGVYTVSNCEATSNTANGINFGRQVSADMDACKSTYNQVNGIGVNVNSRVIMSDCSGIGNGNSGLLVMDNCAAVLRGQGEFSKNKMHGIYTVRSSYVSADEGFAGKIQNNRAWGVYAGWGANCIGLLSRSVISGNSAGNTLAGPGSSVSW